MFMMKLMLLGRRCERRDDRRKMGGCKPQFTYAKEGGGVSNI